MHQMNLQPIPVTVIGGYLGSGKTTLVNHLLRNAEGRRLVIMVNEFGELPIDEDLIEAQGDDLISLAGGCVCCSYGSDLIEAMTRMARRAPRPDNLLLEASGVALPASIAGTVSLMPDFCVDGIVVLVDAETVRQRAEDRYMGDTLVRQLNDADIVLLNKTDLVATDRLGIIRDWIHGLAPDTPIIDSERSSVAAAIILQDFERGAPRNSDEGTHRHAGFEARTLVIDEPVEVSSLAVKLILENPGLVRAKGFVRDHDGRMKTIQIVGRRTEITAAPEGVANGLVIICAT